MDKHLNKIRELIVNLNGVDCGIFNSFKIPVIWIRCKNPYDIKGVWFNLFDYLRDNDLRNKIILNEMYIFPKGN